MFIPKNTLAFNQRFSFPILVLFAVSLLSTLLWSQATISTGSIQGTVTDPSGAVVPGATVTVTNRTTGQAITLTTNQSGAYNAGSLTPGAYLVRVEAKGFQTLEQAVLVQVGAIAGGNLKLKLGLGTEIVSVEENAIQVNTQQATVQGVITAEQMERLPINGRNFLDLAQLEPGVQIQDGGNFDPTKNGFSSISFGGRFGRTARIEVDGVDISDETVGTTTQNIPQAALQEFQLSQSSLDPSTELTSSGAVNVTTRQGGNSWHGEGFYLFRDDAMAADLSGIGVGVPFQRNHFGGRLGGPVIKNNLFFFLAAERIKQDVFNSVALNSPFTGLSGGYNSPLRETEPFGRLDWQIKPASMRIFYRFSYENNLTVKAFNAQAYQPFANRNNTPVHALGADFLTGSYTHSVRFSYTKFTNHVSDAVTGSNIINPAPTLGISIGSGNDVFCDSAAAFCSGPSFLAPQATFQSSKQIKYDGSKAVGSHTLRYGIAYNRILGGGFAKFFGLAPSVNAQNSAANVAFADGVANPFCPGAPCFPGGRANPLNYPVDTVLLGNGQGFFTERPEFGLPAGGQFDTRVQWYVADNFKARRNLNISLGLRYVRDTGRTDSDLGPIPELNQFGAGLGDRVRQPSGNFAPQLGIAWDPRSNGKTVFRGGIGLYYENVIFNNVLFDRPGRLQQGLFFASTLACFLGSAIPVSLPDGSTVNPTFCGQPIGQAEPQIAALQALFQSTTAAAGPAVNPVFVGTALSASANSTGTNLFAPNYETPRSVQMNFGIQHEFAPGLVLSADYVRNVQTHSLLAVDTNFQGDARFFDPVTAAAAISATLAACGVATIDQAIAGCPNNDNIPATISDFGDHGLGGGIQVTGGFPAAAAAAFPGINPNVGTNQMLFPIGRSVYSGLQLSLRHDKKDPIPFVKRLNTTVSYALSRYKNTVGNPNGDQDFVNTAVDNRNPTSFFGPSALDRTSQLSFGTILEFPKALQVSFVGHFSSGLPRTLTLPQGCGAAEIFCTDVTGDGTVGDLLPGTNIGAFGRGLSAGDINGAISNYNSTQAGTLTPAGQALVTSGLMTQAQLVALGGTLPTLALAPAGQVGTDYLKTFDAKLAWPIKIRERLSIEPSFSAFNLFNFANFDQPGGNVLNGELNGQAGSVNGTTKQGTDPSTARANRILLGTGTFAFGAPRILEFGLRVTF